MDGQKSIKASLRNAESSFNHIFLSIDALLSGVPQIILSKRPYDAATKAEVTRVLRGIAKQSLLISDLAIYDLAGDEIFSSAPSGRQRMNVGSAFLQEIKDEKLSRMYISRPSLSLRSGEWVIHAARPITLVGQETVLIVAEIQIKNISDRLPQPLEPNSPILRVETADGKLLINVPFDPIAFGGPGPGPRPSWLVADGQIRTSIDRFSKSPVLIAWHSTLYSPNQIGAMLPLQIIELEWGRNIRPFIGVIVFLTLLIVTSGGLAHAYIRHREKVISELAAARRKAEEASHAKSMFLANMSHELRTPLNAILGFGQMLHMDKKNPLSEKQKEYLDYMIASGNHLLSLIDQILDLAKIESGTTRISIENVEIGALLDEVLDMTSSGAIERNITLQCVYAPERPLWVRADKIKLKQVFLNLISNAIKYNKENGKVVVRCRLGDKQTCRFDVEDTGIGIPDHKMGDLFKPFNRLGLEGEAVDGTGIGLAISYNLLKLMKSELQCGSRVGIGSTFWFELKTGEQRGAAA